MASAMDELPKYILKIMGSTFAIKSIPFITEQLLGTGKPLTSDQRYNYQEQSAIIKLGLRQN
jgi:hypothetical protein